MAGTPEPPPPSAVAAVAEGLASRSRYELCARLMLDAESSDGVVRRPTHELEAAVAEAQLGAFLLKFGRSGKPCKRYVRVNDAGDAVYWESRRKKLADSTVRFADVERIQKGQHTSVFARHAKEYRHLGERCISIVRPGSRTLDLMFDSEAQLDTWYVALTALLLRQRAAGEDSDIKQLWRAFGAEEARAGSVDGRLGYAGIKAILRKLNIYRDKPTLKRMMAAVVAEPRAAAGGGEGADAPSADAAGGAGGAPLPAPAQTLPAPAAPAAGEPLLAFHDFVRLVDLMRDRPDIEAVFRSLIGGGAAPAAAPGVLRSSTDAAPAAGAGGGAGGSTSPRRQRAASGSSVAALTAGAFLDFLVREQQESHATLADARRIAAHFDPGGRGRSISLPAFVAYVTSPANSAAAPETASVWQDMGQPLSAYFIESSHNTYLEGDQFQSAASASMYITVLQRGCRCVELDCWDGPDGEPIIYHGHTLTGRVPFVDVVRAVAAFGFRSSPYPVILSLEVHCTPRQQNRMADILRSQLGSQLALPPADRGAPGDAGGEWLPSPASLMGLVVIKAKMKGTVGQPPPAVVAAELPPIATASAAIMAAVAASSTSAAASTAVADAFEGPRPGGATSTAPAAAPPSPAPRSLEVPMESLYASPAPAIVAARSAAASPEAPPLPRGRSSRGNSRDGTPTGGGAGGKRRESRGGDGSGGGDTASSSRETLTPALRSLVMLQAVKFTSFEASAAAGERPWHMSSLKEPFAARAVVSRPFAAVTHTQRQLLRVYPGPLRVDSSNFNPAPYWAAGVQMVALNYQTWDVPLRLNDAFFRLNGRCGYVLKPQYMRSPAAVATLLNAERRREAAATAVATGGAAVVALAPRGAESPTVASAASGSTGVGVSADVLVARIARAISGSLSAPSSPPASTLPVARAAVDAPAAPPPARVLDVRSGDEARPHVSDECAGRSSSAAVGVESSSPPPSSTAGGVAPPSPPLVVCDLATPAAAAAAATAAGAHPPPPPPPPASSSSSFPEALPRVSSTLSMGMGRLPSPLRSFAKSWMKRSTGPASPFRRNVSPAVVATPGPSPLVLPPPDAALPGAGGPAAATLVVTLMGGQHLPQRGGAGGGGGVPSPQCSVIVYGDTADTAKQRSRTVADNGFNPVWSEQFRFALARPETAVLYIAVHDQLDVARTSLLGYFAAPVAALRSGYRSCQLRNAQGKKLPFCSLQCRFQSERPAPRAT